MEWEDGPEATDGQETTEAAAPESAGSAAGDSAAGDVGDAGGGDEGGGDIEAPAAEPAGPEAVVSWDGELQSLLEADWYKNLDPTIKQQLDAGLQVKLSNYEKAYKPRYEELANIKKRLDRKEQELKDQEKRLSYWFTGEEDPIAAKQAEIDELKKMHAAALKRVDTDMKQRIEKALAEAHGKLSEYDKANKAWEQRYNQLSNQMKAESEALAQSVAEDVGGWLEEEAPDIYAHDDRFELFVKLTENMVSIEDAVQMVRAKFGTPEAPEPEPEPEPVPAGIAAMNMGKKASDTVKVEDEDYFALKERLRRANM